MVWQPLPSLLDHKKLIMKTPRLDQAQAQSSPLHSSEDLLAAPVGSINR
ncbi:unnamed protein product, partial [Timema podura]|nr:unnamed protein product [Timema podura]